MKDTTWHSHRYALCFNTCYIPPPFVFLVVQHLRTRSERASEIAVTATVTRLTATKTPTRVPVVTCLQRKRWSWRLQALNQHLWSKVSSHRQFHQPHKWMQHHACSDQRLSIRFFFCAAWAPELGGCNFILFLLCSLHFSHFVCMPVWVFEGERAGAHSLHVLSLSKQTSPLCFYKPNYFSLSI